MATTVMEILEMAYAKSTQNNPGTIATESVELLGVVQRVLDGCYAVAARVNPIMFAESAIVAPVTNAWPRPPTAESIFLIEKADGSTVAVVPYDDQGAESAWPSIYEYGQQFFTAKDLTDPDDASDSLTFFYAKSPDILTAPADALDSMWPEQFNELIVLHVANYLATKDFGTQGREGEIKSLAIEIERWANRYVAFLEHATANTRKRHSHFKRINTNSYIPIFSIIGATGIGATK